MRIKISVLFLLASSVCWAQFSLQGKLTQENGLPLRDVHIHVGKKITVSDVNGNYIITQIPKGKQKVYYSYIGYQSITVELDFNQDLNYDVQLIPSVDELEEIIFINAANLKNQTIKENVIKKATIEKYSNQTLGDALREVSGVSLMKTGSTIVKPIINGLHSNRIPIISNSVRLEDQQWGTEHAPNFDINSAGKITVIKGASALQFGGDAIGGIVIIEPEVVKKDTLLGKTLVNLSSNGKGGNITTNLIKGNQMGWNYQINGTYKYLGDRETPNYVLSNSGNREQNFSTSIGFSTDKYTFNGFYSFYNAQIGIIKASHIGNVNDLYESIQNQTPNIIESFTYQLDEPKQQVKHHLAKIQLQKWLSDYANLDMQYAFQFNHRQEFDVRRNSFNDKAALDLQLATHTLKVEVKNSKEAIKWKTGINLGYQNNYADPKTGVRPLIPGYDKFELGFYGTGNYALNNSTTIETGIRYDFMAIEATKYYLKSRWEERNYDEEFSRFIVREEGNQWLTNPSFEYHNVSASIGIKKVFHHEMEWFSNVSLASRNPNASELFSDGLHHSTGQIELGDLRLKKENSFKINTSFSKYWNTRNVQITPFLNSISNFMFLQPIGFETTIRGAFPVWDFKQTEALLYGVDITHNWKINDTFSHDLMLSYVRGKDVSNKTDLIDIHPLNMMNKISLTKEQWNHFQAEIKSEWVFRQNRFPNNNFETNIVQNNTLTAVNIDVSSPPNGYHLLHFYSQMEFKVFDKNTISTSFSIQNILNTTYRDYLNRQRFFVDEMGRNFQIQIKYNY